MNIATILTANYPNAQWTLNGDDYEGLTWLDETHQPSESELEAQWESVQSALQLQEQNKIDARQSALAKLADLGLTAEEIAAL